MKNYLKKVTHIIPLYILVMVFSLLFLGGLRYLLDIKYHIVDFKLITWEFYIPLVMGALSLYLIRKRFYILDKGLDFMFFVSGTLFFIILIQGQKYITKSNEKTKIIRDISYIKSNDQATHYQLNNYNIDDTYIRYTFDSRSVGKYKNKLVVSFYYVVAMESEGIPKVWLVNKKKSDAVGYIGDGKEKLIREFKEESYNFIDTIQENSKYNFFKKVPNSSDKDLYISLIKKSLNMDISEDSMILLEPQKPEDIGEGSGLKIILITFGIGVLLLLIILIFLSYKKYKSSNSEEEIIILIKEFFTLKKGYWASPILVEANILIFILMIFSGVDVFHPISSDLVRVGAVSPKVEEGELWRFITSIFLHSGVRHLLYNVIILAVSGVWLEKNMDSRVLFFLYFFIGVSAAVSSYIWHGGAILLGASGAVFGFIGIILGRLIRDFRQNNIYIFLIIAYIGMNLLFGLFTNSDNVAHLSGLSFGLILSLFLYDKK